MYYVILRYHFNCYFCCSIESMRTKKFVLMDEDFREDYRKGYISPRKKAVDLI